MLKRIKEIIELIRILYVRISIACCCRSDCQIGRDSNGNKIPKTAPNSPSNDNHIDDIRAAHTSII
jgi:hypothetical protein